MSVFHVISARPNPGRRDEVVDRVREKLSITERLATGFKGLKLYSSSIDGVGTGVLHMAIEYEDYSCWATSYQNEMHDERSRDLLKRATGSEMPVDSHRAVLLEDRIKDPSREFTIGPVLQMSVVQVKPGRAGDIPATRERVAELAVRSGARDYRSLEYVISGPTNAGLALAIFYFEDFKALETSLQQQRNDPDWIELWNELASPDSPVEIKGQRILTEVPLR